MANRAFVVAKEVYHHNNRDNPILWEWYNDEIDFLELTSIVFIKIYTLCMILIWIDIYIYD